MAESVTELLLKFSKGNEEAVNDIFSLIYDELKRLANNYLRNERGNHTLQPTALVHEAYLKLVNHTRINWQNRAHFLGMAATLMRQILIDHARRHRAGKRGGEHENLQLEESIVIVAGEKPTDLIRLDEALKDLAKFDEFKSRLVELRYFGGLSVEQTAEVLSVSEITVKRNWRMPKAWLAEAINN
jgi:RNA polymerase sigma factor (TIGR02999 family)